MIEISESIPSKKNCYEVHFNQRFWQALTRSGLLSIFRGAKWWIAPSAEVKAAEQLLAWRFKSALPDFGDKRVCVTIGLRGNVQDSDNVLGVVFDALQLSGRIRNDRQIARHVVERIGPGKGITVTVEEWK